MKVIIMMEPGTDTEEKCMRCKRLPPVEGGTRCEECLEYARNWQKKKTAQRKRDKKCISCGAKSGGLSRCPICRDKKSEAYFEKKREAVSVSA